MRLCGARQLVGRHIGRMVLAAGLLLSVAPPARAQIATAPAPAIDNPFGIPDLTQYAPPARDGEGVTSTMRIFVLLTILALAPSILIMMTSFTRIMIVLSLLRQAMGTQQLPPGQVLVGISLILTLITMAPTWQRMKLAGIDPYLDGKLSQTEAFDKSVAPLRDFMFKQIEAAENEENVYLFYEYSRSPIPEGEVLRRGDVGLIELVPAFLLSELETSFVMGFRLYLPFLVIDMVISAILISMGMMMLPPVLISLPFKVMLFVLADGWGLVIGSVLHSFAT